MKSPLDLDTPSLATRMVIRVRREKNRYHGRIGRRVASGRGGVGLLNHEQKYNQNGLSFLDLLQLYLATGANNLSGLRRLGLILSEGNLRILQSQNNIAISEYNIAISEYG